ncbi:MAG: YabP/YqfC family sporulation protein [Clostridia bacterium]|nr:YabP/YqfC family sporulation protein [Clostridia bacterium]
MQKREKGKLKSKIAAEIFSDEPKIEMSGNREIIIDGCKGVIEYDENTIKLSLGKNALSISGDNLVINSFDSSVAIISGVICEIFFVS